MTLFNRKMQKLPTNASNTPEAESALKTEQKYQDHEIEKHVGKKIKLFRQLKGLSQSDVAVHLGITFQQFQKYESGKNRIPVSRLMKLAEIFRVNMSTFFENSVNVMFEDIMAKKSSSLHEDFTPIVEYSKKQAKHEITGNNFNTVNETEDDLNLAHRIKQIKNANLKRQISELIDTIISKEN